MIAPSTEPVPAEVAKLVPSTVAQPPRMPLVLAVVVLIVPAVSESVSRPAAVSVMGPRFNVAPVAAAMVLAPAVIVAPATVWVGPLVGA